MIEIANQRFRNLQEQVAWLTLMINRATDIVKNIAGTAAVVADLAPASTYSNGTVFAIGTQAPYDYYVALNGNWVDLGTMPLAGPAGTDGKNGYNVLLTSQATTSSTSFIYAASIYDPESRGWKAGDLIFSEQGDVFVVTAATAAGAGVIYRYNIKGPIGEPGGTGPQGPRGLSWFEGTDLTYSAGSYSWDSSDWPAGTNPMPGDLYLITSDYGGGIFTEGSVYVVTNVLAYGAQLSYLLSLKGPRGAAGQDGDVGSLFYYGTDLTYDALGLQVEVLLSDVPLRVGDYYLITADYTDGGHDFYLGDVYVCTAVSSITADLTYAANIRGPQGAAGIDGATIFNGTDVYHTGGSGGAYVIDVTDVPTMKANDYYLSTSTYTSDGETISEGDLWQALNLALSDTAWLLTRVVNLKGASGSSAWGSITGTLADQTDLQSALDGKLSLSGGTITGPIAHAATSTSFVFLKVGTRTIVSAQDAAVGIGNTNTAVTINTNASNVHHKRGTSTYDLLDTYNTKVNESGATNILTEYTHNSTKYKVPTAAGGFTFSVSGSQGEFDLYVMGYISGEYGLHHLTKSSGANIYRNGTSAGATSITIANASFIIPKDAETTGLSSATGDAYTAAGVSAAYIDWGGTYKNQQLHLDSNYTIVYAS